MQWRDKQKFGEMTGLIKLDGVTSRLTLYLFRLYIITKRFLAYLLRFYDFSLCITLLRILPYLSCFYAYLSLSYLAVIPLNLPLK